METSQTSENMVHYDGKKTLVLLKEKLTIEGLDNYNISIKLKEAHDAIQRACDACLLTHEDDIQDFYDDHTFSKLYHYCLENVENRMRNNNSTNSEVSDALKRAKRAILAAKDACITDAERAELLRIKNLGVDENPYEDVVYEKFDADSESGLCKDKVVVLQEQLNSLRADKSEISTSLKEAESVIQRVFSACAFNDKEKQIFRFDINGKYSGDLLYLMSYRLKKLGHDEVAVEEMIEVACDAIQDSENFFYACVNRHRGDIEDADDKYDYRDRIDDLREQMILRDIDNSEISVRLKEAEEAIQRVFFVSALTDRENKMFRCDINGDHTRDIESAMLARMLKKGCDASIVEEVSTKTKEAIQDANCFFNSCMVRYGVDLTDVYAKCGSKEKILDLEEKLIHEGVGKSEILKRLEVAEGAIRHVFSVCEFSDKERWIFSYDIDGRYSDDLIYSMLRRLSKRGYDVDELKNMRKIAYDAIEAVEDAFRIGVPRHEADDKKGVESSKRPRMDFYSWK